MNIQSVAAFCPPNSMSNDQLIAEYGLDSNHDWIVERTGIFSRNICAEDVFAKDMAVEVAKLLKIADKSKVRIVIVATSTHAQSFPSISVSVHEVLGLASDVVCFDLNDACNGFVQAVSVAEKFLETPDDLAVVIGVDKMSQIVDPSDRSVAILFGDGAGGVVIGKNSKQYVSTSYTLSEYKDDLYANPKVFMNGNKVFKYAINSICSDIGNVLEKNNITKEMVRFFIPHQANSRIIEAVREKLGISENKMVNVIKNLGNTSAATIPLAILEVYDRLNPGDLIVLSGFASGFRGGSVLLER